MKPTLIALALAALPAMATATENNLELYGQVKGELGRSTITNGPGNAGVNDNTSIVGIKGHETMGNGLRAIWQVESRVHVDGNNSADYFGTRQTFVGLDGGALGKVRIGYLNSALNDLYAIDTWQYNGNVGNPQGNASRNSGVNGLVVLSNPGNRLKNAIRYDTADFAGFTANVSYGFGENKANATGGNPQINRASDIVSAGANYKRGPYAASYAIQREANPRGFTPAGQSGAQSGNSIQPATIQYAELRYDNEKLFVGMGYQMATGYDWTDGFSGDSQTSFGTGATPLSPAQAQLKTRQAALTVAYTIQDTYVPKVSLAKGWDQYAGGHKLDGSGYKQFVLGVDYKMSKRTTTGVSYGHLTFDKNARAAINNSKTTLTTTALTLSHKF